MKISQITMMCLVLVGSLALMSPIQHILGESVQVSRWQIVEWNGNFVGAWNWPDVYFQVINGSYLNYTTNRYDPANFTHPSDGTIEFGNLTIQATNNKTAEVLALSIWGWFPGLITSTNWNMHEQVAQEAASGQFTDGSFTRKDTRYSYQGVSRQAVNFTYRQDPAIGNQNTTLVYDKKTGVLLEGYSELNFGELFVLRLNLVYSDHIKQDNLTPLLLIPSFLAILSVGTIYRKIRRDR